MTAVKQSSSSFDSSPEPSPASLGLQRIEVIDELASRPLKEQNRMMREIANPAHRLIPRGFERLRCDRGDYGHDFRLAQYGVAIAPSKMGSPGAIFRTVLGNFMLRSRQRLRIAASKF